MLSKVIFTLQVNLDSKERFLVLFLFTRFSLSGLSILIRWSQLETFIIGRPIPSSIRRKEVHRSASQGGGRPRPSTPILSFYRYYPYWTDFWKTNPKQSIQSIMIFKEFLGVTQTNFWKTHPNMDEFFRNKSSSCPGD